MRNGFLLRSIGIGVLLLLITGGVLYLQQTNINRPGNHQGYAPKQPIDFSHQMHAGELEISCNYCHTSVEKSQTAEIPATSTCMNCHKFVSAPWDSVKLEDQQAEEEERDPQLIVSEKIEKIYESAGFDPQAMKYSEMEGAHAIRWTKVHNLPDFVAFEHRRHVTVGVDCQQCHGDVAAMGRVEQAKTLSMGWCVNCHRDVNNDRISGLEERYASTDCGVCHY